MTGEPIPNGGHVPSSVRQEDDLNANLAGLKGSGPEVQRLVAYVADLEVEVDRLRRHSRQVHAEAWSGLQRLRRLCADSGSSGAAPAGLGEVSAAVDQLADLLRDLQDLPGYHPAHDQVIAVAVRPLAEQIFRWHQRLARAENARLILELQTEHVDWFPARLRHILDNLISNALKYRDQEKGEMRVQLHLRETPAGYELRVSDNGVGLASNERDRAFDLLSRAGGTRGGLGVGLAVVKRLVEQSNGALTIAAGEGQGTSIVVLLPRYDLDDFLV
jgi:signal transduction histidine kinase